MKLIGLSGYARSGKDEAAKALEALGYQRIAFADKLRDFLYALNPIVAVEDAEIKVRSGDDVKRLMLDEFTPSTIMIPVYVQQVIDKFGWDGYKNSKYGSEVRRLLQRLGTEAGRETLWDSIWIDAALRNLDSNGKYVVTDVRFPNEADAVRNLGGNLWRINRAGVGPATAEDGTVHKSETSLDKYQDFKYWLSNNGSIDQFHAMVRHVGQLD